MVCNGSVAYEDDDETHAVILQFPNVIRQTGVTHFVICEIPIVLHVIDVTVLNVL